MYIPAVPPLLVFCKNTQLLFGDNGAGRTVLKSLRGGLHTLPTKMLSAQGISLCHVSRATLLVHVLSLLYAGGTSKSTLFRK